MAAHEMAAARYMERQFRVGTIEELTAGDVVAVSGRVWAKPVQMEPELPQFPEALMVTRRFETYHSGKHGGWRTDDADRWLSESATLGGWTLAPELIRSAGFDWHRASPCSDYGLPEGWYAECPGAQYAFDRADDDHRLSYEITPITAQTYTLIAAVARDARTLVPIDPRLSAGSGNLSILAHGAEDPRAVLAKQTAQAQRGLVLWSVAILLVAVGWMYARIGGYGPGRFWGAAWRGLIVAAPFASLHWPFESDVLVGVDIVALAAAAVLAALFSWRAAPPRRRRWQSRGGFSNS
jgi:hypothetical protein